MGATHSIISRVNSEYHKLYNCDKSHCCNRFYSMSTYQTCYCNCNGVIIWSVCKLIIPCICIHHAYACTLTEGVQHKLKELTKFTNPHTAAQQPKPPPTLQYSVWCPKKILCGCVHVCTYAHNRWQVTITGSFKSYLKNVLPFKTQ